MLSVRNDTLDTYRIFPSNLFRKIKFTSQNLIFTAHAYLSAKDNNFRLWFLQLIAWDGWSLCSKIPIKCPSSDRNRGFTPRKSHSSCIYSQKKWNYWIILTGEKSLILFLIWYEGNYPSPLPIWFFECFYLISILPRNIVGFLTRNVISILMNHSWVKCKDLDHFYWLRFLCYHLLQLDLWPRRIPNDTFINRKFLQTSKILKIDKKLGFQSKPKHLILTNKATMFLILKTFSRRIQVFHN